MVGSGANPNPKILLTKPGSSRPDQAGGSAPSAPHHVVKLMRINDHRADEDLAPAASAAAAAAAARSNRLSLHGSLSLISESWEIYPDRLLPLLSENTDFTVIGVLGAPGVGKSTIMNELYGFDSISPGVPPPFSVLSDESKAMARHCSVGVELRMCAERFILLDTQPLFSASILADLMRPDGSSSISVLTGETLSAELAHEMMGIQLGVFLASVCHVLLLVAEGLHDISLWRLMLTVEMLKQGIPDPSLINLGSNGSHVHQISGDKDEEDGMQEDIAEFFADTIFIHTKLREHECSWYNIKCLKKALSLYFPAPAFRRNGAVQYVLPQFSSRAQMNKDPVNLQNNASGEEDDKDKDSEDEEKGGVSYFVLPLRSSDDAVKVQHESYTVMLGQLRDQILNMNRRPFARPMSERDWLRNSARIWDSIKKSPVLVDYCKTLQHSGLYRR